MSKTIYVPVEYVEKREVKVREFTIHIVPNRFNVMYGEYVKKTQSILNLTEKLNAAQTPEEVAAIEKSLIGLDLPATLKMKYELVNSVMRANDYEFEEEWWDTRVDPQSVEAFIVKCALKDTFTDSKKKQVLQQLGFLTTED